MKKTILTIIAAALSMSAVAQTTITVPEPEFINGYYHLTSDSTYAEFAKEQGELKKKESVLGKIGKYADSAAGLAGSLAGLGAATGNFGTALGGLQAMTGAGSVANATSAINNLTGLEGFDIVFNGKNSSYTIPEGSEVKFIYRASSNDTDPRDMMRIVKFKGEKKKRSIHWINITSSLLGSSDATNNGYVDFTGKKYGESSYLITISSNNLPKGEYGIILGSVEVSAVIPVATFSVQ